MQVDPMKMADYLFDLRGYLVLEKALTTEHVQAINDAINGYVDLQPNEWRGHVHRQNHPASRGVNLQNITEAGRPFEKLIDHPAWLEHVRRYVGKDEGLYIDEAFASVRGPGQFINIHSGGDRRSIRTQFRFHNNQFHCGQINILIALTDIGQGDGATVVVPGSHKSNLPHPRLDRDYSEVIGEPANNVEGAIEVYLKAGDALLFVDAICHGSASRTNKGERRIAVYRYGPRWGNSRFGYSPSDELLARVTEQQRSILQPVPPLKPAAAQPVR